MLERAKKSLSTIDAEYQKTLRVKIIENNLKIDIKDYFSKLRSILDYLAHDIVEKYCPTADPKNKLYFPIRADQASFENEMRKAYPNLIADNKIIYDVLASVQPFQRPENNWLLNFNKLNNENKHEQLVAQKRMETKRVNVQFNNGSVSWNPSAVRFGAGISIGGVPVNPQTQMPQTSNTQAVTIETWVDFRFEGLDVSVLELTRESLKQIQKIYDDIKGEI